MGAFEEIVAAYGERPFVSEHPSTYRPDPGKVVGVPTGDGDYTAVIPCPICGGSSLLLFDDRVECQGCFADREQVEVVDEQVVLFDLALNRLGELVQDTQGEAARKRLHDFLALASLTLALWTERTA